MLPLAWCRLDVDRYYIKVRSGVPVTHSPLVYTEDGAKMDFPFFFGTSGFPSHKVAEILGLFGAFDGS